MSALGDKPSMAAAREGSAESARGERWGGGSGGRKSECVHESDKKGERKLAQDIYRHKER